jgi:hypothetical protein
VEGVSPVVDEVAPETTMFDDDPVREREGG